VTAKPFAAASKWITDVDADSAARLVAASGDVVLVVDGAETGVIKDIAYGSDEMAQDIRRDTGGDWVGQRWVDIVSTESRGKVEQLLADAAAGKTSRWRHVNHRTDKVDGLPILYSTTQIGRRGRIIAIGRSLRPITTLQQRLLESQMAIDREYARLRHIETRHRLLFQLSAEAVLIADGARRLVEANPAACRLLGTSVERLAGRAIEEIVDSSSRRAFDTLLSTVLATGRAEDHRVRLARRGPEFNASVVTFREETTTFYLVRLCPVTAPVGAPPQRVQRISDLTDQSPDGFVVTGLDGRIEFANRSFLDLTELANEEQARGEPIDRWFGRPGVDFNLLVAHLREHGSVRLYATTVRGQYGSSADVEICATSLIDAEKPCLGFSIRNVSARLAGDRGLSREHPRSVEQLMELVGRVPLKELVRESSDMIEKLCIEAALELTGDNRASAAEILGLSRQSLYSKLHRYGLGDLDGDRRDR
jgi:transcriptional regulator PpsR